MKRIMLFTVTLMLFISSMGFSAHANVEDDEFRAIRAIRISECEVVIEFTKPLDENGINLPWTSLRWMNMSDGKPTSLAWENDMPLQQGMLLWHFWSNESHDKIVLVFEADTLDAYAQTTENQYYEKGYRAFLSIEEKYPGEGHDHKTLHDVHSEDGQELRSNCEATGDNWDGVCLKIEKDYNYIPSSYVYTPETDTPQISPTPTATPNNSAVNEPSDSDNNTAYAVIAVAAVLGIIAVLLFVIKNKRKQTH